VRASGVNAGRIQSDPFLTAELNYDVSNAGQQGPDGFDQI
jgi:hypothetical protein